MKAMEDCPQKPPPDRRISPGLHPRRKPAHQSVSLVHQIPESPPRLVSSEDETTGSNMQADTSSNPPSAPVSRPSYQKYSSGESSNPEKWFEKSNNNPKSRTDLVEDDRPYFLRTSSSETSPPMALQQHSAAAHSGRNAMRADQIRAADTLSGSSSEDFRGVIDDLTIENKRLKRKLRKYEKQNDPGMQEQKLFEVRVYGLSMDKKRELENLLREFVTNLEGSSPQSQSQLDSGVGSYRPSMLQPGLTTQSSNTSTRIGDSGYGSMSAAGQRVLAPGQPSGQMKSMRAQSMSTQQKQDIQMYLRDVPPGLLPNSSGPMSEKKKRKAVVRRLEYIFAGRDSSVEGHQQPIQQQKVARSAARADRREAVERGEEDMLEGIREAKIMQEADSPMQTPAQRENVEVGYGNGFGDVGVGGGKTSLNDVITAALAEQRPTRPLDLDPFRAQVPEENIKYMRHLGFSPKDADSVEEQDGARGWVYLNVLTNLAQLHTINVTTEFIRNAICDYSHKLELSSDGRKVRWKGGPDVTALSIENSPDQPGFGEASESKLSADSGSKSLSSDGAPLAQELDNKHKLSYSPLFHHKAVSSFGSGSHIEAERLTNRSYNLAGNNYSGKLSPPGARARPGHHKLGDDAPIIFYQKAAFYTDLSGDTTTQQHEYPNPRNHPRQPIGGAPSARVDALRRQHVEKGPLSRTKPAPGSVNSDGASLVASESDLKVLGLLSRHSTSSSDETPDPIEFEASGLGGVLPADNFSIAVKSRQNRPAAQPSRTKVPDHASAVAEDDAMQVDAQPARRKMYQSAIRSALERKHLAQQHQQHHRGIAAPRRRVHREIIGSRTKTLPASELPPPSYYQSGSDQPDDSDYDTDESEDGCSVVDEFEEEEDDVVVGEPMLVDWAATGWPGNNIATRQKKLNGDDDDGSLSSEKAAAPASSSASFGGDEGFEDAGSGRKGDHLRVGECADGAEPWTGMILAGDSAATAEGGSGFNSPSLVMSSQLAQAGSQMQQGGVGGKRRGVSLKRARKSDDSMAVQGGRATKSPKLDEGEE